MPQSESLAVHASLYHLFVKFSQSAHPAPAALVNAITVHSEFEFFLRLGCGRVLVRVKRHSDTRHDLLQESRCLLVAALRNGKIKYEDRGIESFRGWIVSVTYHLALRAIRSCQPIAVGHCVLVDNDFLNEYATDEADRIGLEDVLIEIKRLHDHQMQTVLRLLAFGFSSEEITLRTGLSHSTIFRMQKRGFAEIKKQLTHDDGVSRR